MVKAIIFDYDGVLVDSATWLHQFYLMVSQKFGKNCPQNFEEFRKIYGYTYFECMDNLGFSEQNVKDTQPLYREYCLSVNPSLFSQIKDVLHQLKEKYTLIILSANYASAIRETLAKEGVLDFFHNVYGHDGVQIKQLDKVKFFKKILEDYGWSGEEIIAIGDRAIDYTSARDAGIKNILLVEYGWKYKLEDIEGHTQDVTIREPNDIIEAINSIIT